MKREAITKKALYRKEVHPEMGGKVPESHYHREEFNKLDAMGLKEPLAQVMSDRLKYKKLPEKVEETSYPGSSISEGESSPVALPFTFSSNKFPSFADEFPFESNKLFNFQEQNEPYSTRVPPPPVDGYSVGGPSPPNDGYSVGGPSPPAADIKYPKQNDYYEDNGIEGNGYGNIPKKKPHLFTHDPYATGIADNDVDNEPKFKPPPEGYQPPIGPYNTEFDQGYNGPGPIQDEYEGGGDYGPPYQPIEEDVYNDPEFGPEYSPPPPDYSPPIPHHDEYGEVPIHEDYGPVPVHDSYGPPPPSDEYGPPSSDYGAPSADYGPPKIVGPVLLEKRPYEVKEIKAVPIVTHKTYTKFDCRNVPYPDRHYADPEAGCAVNFNIIYRELSLFQMQELSHFIINYIQYDS